MLRKLIHSCAEYVIYLRYLLNQEIKRLINILHIFAALKVGMKFNWEAKKIKPVFSVFAPMFFLNFSIARLLKNRCYSV
jgi:hypothetical protein